MPEHDLIVEILCISGLHVIRKGQNCATLCQPNHAHAHAPFLDSLVPAPVELFDVNSLA